MSFSSSTSTTSSSSSFSRRSCSCSSCASSRRANEAMDDYDQYKYYPETVEEDILGETLICYLTVLGYYYPEFKHSNDILYDVCEKTVRTNRKNYTDEKLKGIKQHYINDEDGYFDSDLVSLDSFDVCEHCINTICNSDKYYLKYKSKLLPDEYSKVYAYCNTKEEDWIMRIMCDLCYEEPKFPFKLKNTSQKYYYTRDDGNTVEFDTSKYDSNNFAKIQKDLKLLNVYSLYMRRVRIIGLYKPTHDKLRLALAYYTEFKKHLYEIFDKTFAKDILHVITSYI